MTVALVGAEFDRAGQDARVVFQVGQGIDNPFPGRVRARHHQGVDDRLGRRHAVGHEGRRLAIRIGLLVHVQHPLLARTVGQVVERRAIVEIGERRVVADILGEGRRAWDRLDGGHDRNAQAQLVGLLDDQGGGAGIGRDDQDVGTGGPDLQDRSGDIDDFARHPFQRRDLGAGLLDRPDGGRRIGRAIIVVMGEDGDLLALERPQGEVGDGAADGPLGAAEGAEDIAGRWEDSAVARRIQHDVGDLAAGVVFLGGDGGMGAGPAVDHEHLVDRHELLVNADNLGRAAFVVGDDEPDLAAPYATAPVDHVVPGLGGVKRVIAEGLERPRQGRMKADDDLRVGDAGVGVFSGRLAGIEAMGRGRHGHRGGGENAPHRA